MDPTGQRDRMMRMLHRINLETVGGVEISFMNFLRSMRGGQQLLVDADVHPCFRPALEKMGICPLERRDIKTWRGVRLPRSPLQLRSRNAVRRLSDRRVDLVWGWNTFANRELVSIARALAAPLVHYEHGGAWTAANRKRRAAREYFSTVSEVVCNSRASERLLTLRWGYRGRATRIHCPLDEGFKEPAPPRRHPGTGPFKVGLAGRLVPTKGFALALHALPELLERYGLDVTVHIAGTGPDERRLAVLAETLGVRDRVRFHGLVEDMRTFYDQMHIQLVPSLHESFGRISMEAQARACPVVAASVDGLAETLVPGVSGELVPCSLTARDYVALGGNVEGLPEYVYDPTTDRLRAPRAAGPSAIAAAIQRICAEDGTYARYSQNARRQALARFSRARFVREMGAVAARIAGYGG